MSKSRRATSTPKQGKTPPRTRKPQAKISAENSAKKKPRGTPFALGNPWRFPKGQSGNPGGRPKLLSDAYREWLAAEDQDGVPNAAKVAINVGSRAAVGDIQAAKEMRAATEGDKLKLETWQTEIVEALKTGKLTVQDVVNELGLEDARPIIVAAGQALPQSAPAAPGGEPPSAENSA